MILEIGHIQKWPPFAIAVFNGGLKFWCRAARFSPTLPPLTTARVQLKVPHMKSWQRHRNGFCLGLVKLPPKRRSLNNTWSLRCKKPIEIQPETWDHTILFLKGVFMTANQNMLPKGLSATECQVAIISMVFFPKLFNPSSPSPTAKPGQRYLFDVTLNVPRFGARKALKSWVFWISHYSIWLSCLQCVVANNTYNELQIYDFKLVNSVLILCHFSRMRSEGSRFTWGSGGEAVFAKFCVCGRNRPQPFASVRNRLRWRRKALHSGERVWSGPESVSNWVLVAAVIWVSAEEVSVRGICGAAVNWCLQRRCLWEWSVSPHLYWCLQRRCLWEWSVSPQLYRCLQRRCLWEWSVSPQLYWRLQRRRLWEWSVSPQLYWCLQRRCLRDISVAPQLYWCLQRRCLRDISVAPQLYWCLQRRCLWEWAVSPYLFWCLQRRCLRDISVSPQLYRCLQRRCLWEWSVSRQLYWCLQRRRQECPTRVSKECLTRVSSKSVLQGCLTRVSRKSVWQKCQERVSYKSVLQECQGRVSYKSVK